MIVLNKLYVTLVELLIVITILVLMTGIIGINVRHLMQEQRFNTEVSLIVDELRLAQNLMMILGYDVYVRYEKSKTSDGIKFWIDVDKLLNDNWTREVTRKRSLLKAIKRIDFHDRGPQIGTPETNAPNEIKFFSKGSLMSKGVLELSSSENVQASDASVSYICFPGYPSTITSLSSERGSEACDPKNEADYDEKLTVAIQREIAQKNLTEQLNQKNVPVKTNK